MDKQKIADELADLYAELRHVDHELEKAGLCEDERMFAKWQKDRNWIERDIREIREKMGIGENPAEIFT